jgi:hypothetical protein
VGEMFKNRKQQKNASERVKSEFLKIAKSVAYEPKLVQQATKSVY